MESLSLSLSLSQSPPLPPSYSFLLSPSPISPSHWHTQSHSPVQVVDGITPVILNMPTETRKAHPHIRPWHFHPRNICINIAEHRSSKVGHIVQVPSRLGIAFLLRGLCLVPLWKTTTNLTGQQVGPILYHNLKVSKVAQFPSKNMAGSCTCTCICIFYSRGSKGCTGKC